jgi:hypothetical protein
MRTGIPRVVRPVNGAMRVKLTYAPDNRQYLRSIIGPRKGLFVGRDGVWLISADYLDKLIGSLVDEYGQALVELHGKQTPTLCTEPCWSANPETLFDCVCSCAGAFHGGGPPGILVAGGAVAVVPREHTRTRYNVDSDGWRVIRTVLPGVELSDIPVRPLRR